MICVIGCGNLARSDDGVGCVVAQSLLRRLREEPRPGVRVFDAGTGGMEVMFQARGARRLIVVDAARSGSEPGTIFRVPGAELESERTPTFTLHDFRWQHALAAGRRIFAADFPGDVTVFLVEAGSVDFGLGLSEPVTAAALRVAEAVLGLIDEAPPGAADHAA